MRRRAGTINRAASCPPEPPRDFLGMHGEDGGQLQDEVATLRLEAEVRAASMASKEKELEAAASGAAALAAQLARCDQELKQQQRRCCQLDESARRKGIEVHEAAMFTQLVIGRDAGERNDYLAVCERFERANTELKKLWDAKASMVDSATDPPQAAARGTVPLSALPPVLPLVPSAAAPQQRIQLPRATAPKAAPPTDLASAKRLLRDGAAFAKAFQCRNLASGAMPAGWQARQEEVASAAASRVRYWGDDPDEGRSPRAASFASAHTGAGAAAPAPPPRQSPHNTMRDSLRSPLHSRPRAAEDDDHQLRRFDGHVAGTMHSQDASRERRELLRRLALTESQLQEKLRDCAELKAALAARDAQGASDLSAARVRQQLSALRQELQQAKQQASGQQTQREDALAELQHARHQLAGALRSPQSPATQGAAGGGCHDTYSGGEAPAPVPPPALPRGSPTRGGGGGSPRRSA
eukprot:TRINITY_DN28110_c0_g1_i1.p1 TRINITY_DN28110_c0_g1~~TRINITY_DN28110_c0_g1_i1.p1  ORF type:complete len:469 (+),score=149.01 TRINITY_DN28110_c0_g1_i1:80-1486(+)